MVSSAFLDLVSNKIDFNEFIGYIEKKYEISTSDFDYKISYYGDDSKKEYKHYVTLDNQIYIEIHTYLKSDINNSITLMNDTVITTILAYSSHENNKKLIKFMDVLNTFIIKKKKEKDNV